MSLNAAKKNYSHIVSNWNVSIRNELEKVESLLIDTINSEVDIAANLSKHLINAGGKRLRPSLVILSGCATDSDCDKNILIKLAASSELLHMASLIHDDVIDNSQVRRGVDTANALWGNKISVLGGDFLLSKAWNLLAGELDTEIIKLLSQTAVAMTEAEILQAKCFGDMALWQDNYWKIIMGKTAGFFKACCECGAMVARIDADISNAFAGYGENLGIAFQITDDLLDFTGLPEKTGKSIGADVSDGKYTLPILLAWKALSENGKEDFSNLLENSKDDPQTALEVVNIISKSNAVSDAKKMAYDYINKALESISIIEDSIYKQSLISLAEMIVKRDK
ncbi:MAG: polyprenyl synthetase family protein [Armatimonadota bacterium]